jgi:hypothetical protein
VSIGIYRPEDQEGRPFTECRRLYFSDEFLADPPEHFTVEDNAVRCDLREHTVWILTGRSLPLGGRTVHEGEWEE